MDENRAQTELISLFPVGSTRTKLLLMQSSLPPVTCRSATRLQEVVGGPSRGLNLGFTLKSATSLKPRPLAGVTQLARRRIGLMKKSVIVTRYVRLLGG